MRQLGGLREGAGAPGDAVGCGPASEAVAARLCLLGRKSLSIDSIRFNMYLLNASHVFSHERGTMGHVKNILRVPTVRRRVQSCRGDGRRELYI